MLGNVGVMGKCVGCWELERKLLTLLTYLLVVKDLEQKQLILLLYLLVVWKLK